MCSKRYFIAFFVSIAVSFLLTPLLQIAAHRLRFLDYPNERKNHASPIPTLGGLAVYIALACGVFFTFYYSNALKVILAGGLAMLALGMLDDKKDIPTTIKILVLAIFVVVLSMFGVIIRLSDFYILNLIVTFFWVLVVTGAINAIDNMDGLACGISAIASAFFFIAALITQQYLFGIISASLFGATLGFLPYNFKPAKIFLGNGGSFFLGFILSSIAIMAEWSDYPPQSYVIPILILIIPIFDLSFVVLGRHKNGITKSIKEAVTHNARDHISHRLEKLGLTQRRSVLLLYLLSIGIGTSAIIVLPAKSFFIIGLSLFQALAILTVLGIVINVGIKDFKK